MFKIKNSLRKAWDKAIWLKVKTKFKFINSTLQQIWVKVKVEFSKQIHKIRFPFHTGNFSFEILFWNKNKSRDYFTIQK